MVSFNPNMTPCNPNMVCVIQIWFCSDQNVCCPMHQKKILNSPINSILLYIVPCYNFSSGSGTQNFWMGPSSWSRSFTHCKRTDLIQSAAFKHPLPPHTICKNIVTNIQTTQTLVKLNFKCPSIQNGECPIYNSAHLTGHRGQRTPCFISIKWCSNVEKTGVYTLCTH